MDLFALIRRLREVSKVSNLYPQHGERPLDLIFFTCPKMKGGRWRNRIRVNPQGTGFTTTYKEGVTEESLSRVHQAVNFARILTGVGIKVGALTNVFASTDSLILFPIPVSPPPTIPQFDGVRTISNYEVVLGHLTLWGELYREQPWQKVPRWARKMEEERFRKLLPVTAPENLVEDFIRRVFAGFSLDGILIRQGKFGTENPVILGVESPGVAVLQNAALLNKEWLPIIQLGC